MSRCIWPSMDFASDNFFVLYGNGVTESIVVIIQQSSEVLMERLFALSTIAVLPFWVLMIVLPFWAWTHRIIRFPVIALAPAVLYAVLVLPRFAEIWPVVRTPNLPDLAALLSTPAGATIAWAHFLAFDLLVGRWMYLDSRARQISAWLMAPLLFLTLMFGPIGFLLYLGISHSIAWSTDAAAETTSSRPGKEL